MKRYYLRKTETDFRLYKIMLLRTLFFILFVMISAIFPQVPPIEAGVSQNLAKWRSANYSDIRYKLNITLEKGAPLMKGDIEIRVNLTEEGAKNDLVLDWRTTQFQNDKDKPFAEVIAVNGTTGAQASSLANAAFFSGVKTSAADKLELNPNALSLRSLQAGTLALQSNEHLIIPKKYLKTGENVLLVKFASPIKTSGAAVTRYVDKTDGAEYVYSLFVPSDASTAFPVFDQPDLKAQFYLIMYVPEGWKAISNSDLQLYASVFSDDKPTGKVTYRFLQTKPISTYVFAFAAGEFAEFAQRVSGETVNLNEIKAKIAKDKKITSDQQYWAAIGKLLPDFIYVRKSQAEKFKQHAAEVFRLNRESIKYLEDWFDYKFPFPKYDLVLIPEFPFGGMEHAGATFLREDRVIFPTEPTKNDYITRANVIFHEAAHQWFGDTVTMKWFDDLWLKEGFAEFMAYKTLEKVMPEYNAWKIFYERNKQAAYLTDVTRGTTPIYQEIPNLASAKSAYGNIVYRKAPSFLRQAEFYLGEKEFQTAVRAFLKKHEFANAEWTDLVAEFETASKKDLKDWAKEWVMQPGVPIVKTFRGQKFNEYCWGQEADKNDWHLWKMNVNLYFKFTDGSSERELGTFPKLGKIAWDCKQFWKDTNPKTLSFAFPNYQDYGYGIFLLDEKSRAYVLANINAEKDDFLRSMMWGSLWDSVRFYELAPEEYVRLVIKNISVEQDESTINTLLGRISVAMNYYLSDAQRDELAPQIENLLIEKMSKAETLGSRITFYRAFLNVASSEKARNVLKEILNSNFKIQGFNLKTKDKFDIVTRLLVLGDKDALNLLAELEKTETSDEAKRYAYAARAGIGTKENKAKYWNDFTGNKDLSESYIESAFNVFNTPRHSDLTLPYLEKALAELPNLKKNRKIFFVNGWLGPFIGGQKSEEALKIVNDFLEKNPNLDKDLRLKILENVDLIERAVKIRK